MFSKIVALSMDVYGTKAQNYDRNTMWFSSQLQITVTLCIREIDTKLYNGPFVGTRNLFHLKVKIRSQYNIQNTSHHSPWWVSIILLITHTQRPEPNQIRNKSFKSAQKFNWIRSLMGPSDRMEITNINGVPIDYCWNRYNQYIGKIYLQISPII